MKLLRLKIYIYALLVTEKNRTPKSNLSITCHRENYKAKDII